jgi:hypothetical protein
MFDAATKHVSGEKYSSFASALPLLRKIKHHLCDESLFNFSSTSCLDSNFKTIFKSCMADVGILSCVALSRVQ